MKVTATDRIVVDDLNDKCAFFMLSLVQWKPEKSIKWNDFQWKLWWSIVNWSFPLLTIAIVHRLFKSWRLNIRKMNLNLYQKARMDHHFWSISGNIEIHFSSNDLFSSIKSTHIQLKMTLNCYPVWLQGWVEVFVVEQFFYKDCWLDSRMKNCTTVTVL